MTMKKRLFILFFFSTGLVFAQSEGLIPDDIAKLSYVRSAILNDNASIIAYSVLEQADPFKENKPASYKLWLYDLSTGKAFPFVTQGSVHGVSFRPQRGTITFLSRRGSDQNTSLYEISLMGGEAMKIFEHETSISSYEWSPDGKKIAFRAKELVVNEKVLPYEPVIYEENIPLTKAYIADMETGDVRLFNIPRQSYAIHWSPNGNKVAIASAPTALVDDSYMKQRIEIFNVNNYKKTGEVVHDAKLGEFVWSPDSKSIAMIAGADIHDPTAGRLLVVGANGGKPKAIAAKFKGKFEDIEWIDDKTIRFIASEGVYTSVGTIRKNGKKLHKKIDKGNTAFSTISGKGDQMVLVGSAAGHPAELFLYDGKELKKLTNSNPWFKDKKLGEQRVIKYKARDGFDIEGILIMPVGYKAGKRYPLITVVHGGPEAHYDNGWLTHYSSPGQMGAADGYMVFYPNYRGSTGRGEKFAKSSQGDPAGREFDDIIDGIDFLIDEGYVDESKVGVTGGSYGGYATAWMSTRYTDRFAAGVMFVGISDNISKWGTSDIPEEMFLVHSRKRIWDDYNFFLKRSPIYYAGQAKTPLLILGGGSDTRVDPGQSKELYRHIKTRTQTPVRLVIYPGEGHGNRKSTARYDYSLRMMRWFNIYLIGNGEMPDSKLDIK